MLSINISELIWSIICFLVLFFILKHMFFNPLLSFMDERKKRISESSAEVNILKDKVKQLENASYDIISEAETKAKNIISDGQANDASALTAAVEEAKKQLDVIKAEKQEEVSESIRLNSEGIANRREELASALADRILNY